jgi:hypothetical protein
MIRHTVVPVLILIVTTGCVRRDGRNVDCVWPGEAGAAKLDRNQTGYGRHLSADAEFAEQLADRYGLKTARPGDRQSFVLARKRCLDKMFAEVATMHDITPIEVSKHLGANRLLIDITLNLPFVLLYAFISAEMASRIWRRCPPCEGWFVGAVLVLSCSLVFGILGVLLGEQWSAVAECFRIGTDHLGIRVSRLPWVRHRAVLSVSLMFLFCGVATIELLLSKKTSRPPRDTLLNLGLDELKN